MNDPQPKRSSDTGAPKSQWRESLPLELHGHRKKLDFFIRALEDFCNARRMERSAVSIVEIGCSNGKNVSLPLAECGFDVTGVDLHQPSIDWANEHNTFSNARFVCQDANAFVSQRTFDVVVLSDILEHVDEPAKLLDLAKSLLNRNGIVLICIPNGYGPAEIERRFVEVTRIDRLLAGIRGALNRARGRQADAYNNDSGHVQYFRMSSILRLIERAGFVVEMRGKGALFGGALTYPLGRIFRPLVTASLRCADHFPFAIISTWYFKLRPAAGDIK